MTIISLSQTGFGNHSVVKPYVQRVEPAVLRGVLLFVDPYPGMFDDPSAC